MTTETPTPRTNVAIGGGTDRVEILCRQLERELAARSAGMPKRPEPPKDMSDLDAYNERLEDYILALEAYALSLTARWIPVSERLPNPNEKVLIWFRQSYPGWTVSKGEHVSGHWRPEGGNGNFDSDVTHWMPLPEPPHD